MHVVYVDESGDVGGKGSPTRHFVLCAVVVDHVRWAEINAELRRMRERLQEWLGLRVEAEIHASEFLGGSPMHLGMDIRRRFRCAHWILRQLQAMQGLAFARVAVRKGGEIGEIMDAAWESLLLDVGARLPVPWEGRCASRGMQVICDHHAALPYRPRGSLVESLGERAELLELPFGRNSADSQLLQVADLLAFLTKQSIEPNAHFSKNRGRALVRRCEALVGGSCPVVG
jgi:hypothetical protein